MRYLPVGLFVIGLALLLAGCPPGGTSRNGANSRRGTGRATMLKVKGSDTMVNLNQALAEAFQAKKTGVVVAVTGGGSGTGITALISGTADIAASSRPMTDEEVAEARRAGHTPHQTIVGWDGIAVVVHRQNPVKSLTLAQLADIYTGKVTDWRQVGGTPGKIILLGRETTSGTYVFFKEHVLQRLSKRADYSKDTLLLPSTSAIAQEVTTNVKAIGYVGLGYLTPEVRTLPVALQAGATPVMPSEATVLSHAYPISRPLYFYTNGEPTDRVKTFVDFVLSPEGQQVVRELDFVPLQAK